MLRRWEELPEFMRTDAVRPYYKALEKKRYSLYLKRLFDFSISSVMLILLSPVLLGLGIWTRKVLYSTARNGSPSMEGPLRSISSGPWSSTQTGSEAR